MSDPPSTETESSPQTRQSWQRFGLLDAVLLLLGLGLGFVLVLLPEYALGGLRPGAHVVVGLLNGAILGGPIVLFAQRFVHDRREPLSSGERIWLSQSLFAGVGILSSVIACSTLPEYDVVLCLCPLGLIVAILIPAIVLRSLWLVLLGCSGLRDPIPCRWTDTFGLVLSFVTGGLAIFVVSRLMHFP